MCFIVIASFRGIKAKYWVSFEKNYFIKNKLRTKNDL